MTTDFQAILEFISEFGVMLIIAAIFLYTAIRVINMILSTWESHLRDKKHDKLLDVRLSVNEKVQSLIETFLEQHNGDRVHVVEFSNSVVSVAYLPFKYMNCSYEVYTMGKTSFSSNIDKLSTSLFTPFFTQLYKEEYVILDATAPDPKLGGAIYDLMHHGGESHALCAILKTAKGKSLGYVAFKKDTSFSDNDIEDILILADKVSALLGIMDN